MKRMLKWFGIAALALAGLVATGLVVVSCMSSARQEQDYHVDPAPVEVPSAAEDLAEGARLFLARGCGDCHGAGGVGRTMIDDPALGRIVASNLTTATRGYSVVDWVRSVRHGVRPSRKPLVFMPSHDFYPMPDAELGRIIAYVKTLPVRENPLPETEFGPVGRILHVTGAMPMIPAELIDHDAPRPPELVPSVSVEFGRYLAAGCTGCHGATFSGGPIPGAPEEETGIPPNLTPHASGLGAWTEDQFLTAMRTGARPDGRTLDGAKMPWGTFRHMTDVELRAVWAFLRSQPPREFGGR